MTTIKYKFADGHAVTVEVSEELKAVYEELERQEKRYYWKTNKQKARAGLRRQDYSLEKCLADGHEVQSAMPDPLEELILRDEQAAYYTKLLSPLTIRQKEVYILRHVIGLNVAEIARRLSLSESAIHDRLESAYRKTQGIF